MREYLVVRAQDEQVAWFELIDGNYVPKTADANGLLHSTIFPGLWLDPAALLAGNLPTLFATVDKAVQSDGHKAFVKMLNQDAARESNKI